MPDAVLKAVRSLPEQTFATLAEVAQTLGYGKEETGQG